MTQSALTNKLIRKFDHLIPEDKKDAFEAECEEMAIELTKNKPDHLLNQALVRTWYNRRNEAFGI